MAASVMQKAASYSNDNEIESIPRKKRTSKKTKKKKNSNKENEVPKQSKIPKQSTMIKSYSYSEEKKTRAGKSKKTTFSESNDRDLHSKTKRPRRGRKRGQTNKFMSSVNVGQTVKLSKHRIGFVRYKGKVKFSVGIWYGLEIYDSFTKTRHNGTVYGKRYFNCPRSKGLFVRRDVILDIIKPQQIKKELQKLEKDQIQKKKQKDLEEEIQQAAKQKIAIDTRKGMGLSHKNNQHSMLALYQKQVYGNNTLILQLSNSRSAEHEKKIHKDFKRFQRLSFRASHNPEIFSIMQDNENEANEDRDSKEEEEEMLPKGVDIDAEAWDSVKEKPIIEVLDEDNDDDDDDVCKVRLWYPLEKYFSEYQYIFNKGLFIKGIHHHSKQGRALILECGIQSSDGWYITVINDENIKKFSKKAVDEILDELLPDIGYDIVLKRD